MCEKLAYKVIIPLFKNKKIAYLDIPIYYNVGDLLIYKATEEFIKIYNINVIYRSSFHNLNHCKINEADIILLQGGGNFGDLYPKHQKFREDIIKKYPKKIIICLPQSIQFKNELSMLESSVIFSSHDFFYLLVRDTVSYRIGKKFSTRVFLTPDIVENFNNFLINMSYKLKLKNNDCKLFFLRNDIESNHTIDFDKDLKKIIDWHDFINFYDKLILKISILLSQKKIFNKLHIYIWSSHVDILIARCIKYFRYYNFVETDRLHGYILAKLLNINVKLIDNNYKKNSRYYQQWNKINKVDDLNG